MFLTGIVGVQHAVAHMYQTCGPQAKCGPRSLNFKPQPTYSSFFGTVVIYTCVQKPTMVFVMLLLCTNVHPYPIYFVLYFLLLAVYPKI